MRTMIVALVATAGLITAAATGASAAEGIAPTKTAPAAAVKHVQYSPGHRHHWGHRGGYGHGYGSDSGADNLNRQELNSLGAAPQ